MIEMVKLACFREPIGPVAQDEALAYASPAYIHTQCDVPLTHFNRNPAHSAWLRPKAPDVDSAAPRSSISDPTLWGLAGVRELLARERAAHVESGAPPESCRS